MVFLEDPGTEGGQDFLPIGNEDKYPKDIEQIAKQSKITLGNTGRRSHRLAYPPLRLYTPYRRIVAIHIANTKEINAMNILGCWR